MDGRPSVTYVALGVPDDPWEKRPRLDVTDVNGQEVVQSFLARSYASVLTVSSQVTQNKPAPNAIKDHKQSIVALKPGEYAILHLQFRVGDGERITKDWEAFSLLDTLHIPYTLWDGTSNPASLVPSLVLAQSSDPTPESPAKSVRIQFNQRAVKEHYADFIQHGEQAYVRSHFGEERANMAAQAEDMMTMMGEMMLNSVAQNGGTNVLDSS